MTGDPYGQPVPQTAVPQTPVPEAPETEPSAAASPRRVRPPRVAVPADIARSWLLVPATHPESFDEAVASRADAVILDIEDAVDPLNKPQAREDVVKWLQNGGHAWVRINDATSSFWQADLSALSGIPNLLGVMLAKTESAQQVIDTSARLAGNVPIVALVESAVGIEEASAIAKAPGTFRLAFGSGDFRRDTGMSADAEAMAYPRARLVVASRVGRLPGPIDGPTVGESLPLLRDHSAITVLMGMTGKLCLSPEQTHAINEVISPTPTDVAWALDFLADFEGRGRVIRDGSDLPRLGRAQKIEALAIAFGVEPAL